MPQFTYHSIRDTYIDLDLPTTNFGTGSELDIERTASTRKNILLAFDITDQPDSTLITKARLELNVKGTSSATLPWELHRVVRVDWRETSSTWNRYRAGLDWTTAGGAHVGDDIDATDPDVKTGTMPADLVDKTWYNLESVLDFVTDAIDNRSGLVHMRITQTANRVGTFQFRARETPISDEGDPLWPRLIIDVSAFDRGSGYAAMSHFDLVTPKII